MSDANTSPNPPGDASSALAWHGASFADRALEDRFRAWSLDASRRQARTAIGVGTALTLLFAVSDVAFFGLGARTRELFALRLTVALLGGAAVAAMRRGGSVQRFDAWLHTWTAWVGAVVVVLSAARPAGVVLPVLTVAVAVIAMHVLVPTRAVPTGLTTAAMTCAYVGYSAMREGATATHVMPVALSLTLATTVGIVVGRWQHRVRRTQFAEVLDEQGVAARLRDELEIRARTEQALLAAIAARQQAQEALALARDEAEEASRAKTLFLATMSHEIRTPLHGIMTAGQLLSSTVLSTEQHEYVELMRYSGRAILQLVDEVLDLSRVEARALPLNPAPFDPRALLGELSALVRPRVAARGLALRVNVDETPPRALLGDAGRLRQVLLNLLENAIKYSDAGVVELTARAENLDQGRSRLLFAVADRGPGVPESARTSIFEPFVQLSLPGGERGGIGLGLAICKRIVASMGGTITVEDREGGGSCFKFDAEFDAAADDLVEVRRESSLAKIARRASRSLVLLLVDDDEISRRLGAAMLESEGHRVTVAASGEEALEKLRAARFDVVLLDVRMPGLDGVRTVALVRALPARSDVPIVATTANVQPDERAHYLASGFDRVLAKPLDFAQLEVVLEDLVGDGLGALEMPGTERGSPAGDDARGEVLPWIDLALLARHTEALGAAWVDDLLGRLLVTLPATLAEIAHAQARGDRAALRALAHRLMSAADTTGLRRAAAAGARVENEPTDHWVAALLDAGAQSVERVRDHVDRSRAEREGASKGYSASHL